VETISAGTTSICIFCAVLFLEGEECIERKSGWHQVQFECLIYDLACEQIHREAVFILLDKREYQDGTVGGLSEMVAFDKKFHGLIHFLTNFILFGPFCHVGPVVQTTHLHFRTKHHPTHQASKLIHWFNIV